MAHRIREPISKTIEYTYNISDVEFDNMDYSND